MLAALLIFLRLWYPAPVIDTIGYDYAPSAMLDNGKVRVWHTCQAWGDKGSGDAICENGQYQLTPWSGMASWDGRHAGGPSVIRHNFWPLVQVARWWTGDAGVAEPYLMYYECNPQFVHADGSWAVPSPASICLAISNDGKRWWRWSDHDNNGYGEWLQTPNQMPGRVPTPILTNNTLGACGHTFDGQRHILKTPYAIPCNFEYNYGIGHPSAVKRPEGGVRLFVYDSTYYRTNWTSYRYYDSDDGIHFWPAGQIKIADLKGAGPGLEIKYDPTLKRYIALTAFDGTNQFSTGLLNETWEPFQPIGMGRSDTQPAWAHPTLVSDPGGWVNLRDIVTIYSGESRSKVWWADQLAIYSYQGRFQ